MQERSLVFQTQHAEKKLPTLTRSYTNLNCIIPFRVYGDAVEPQPAYDFVGYWHFHYKHGLKGGSLNTQNQIAE